MKIRSNVNYLWGKPSGLDVNVVPTTLPSSPDVEVIVGAPSMRVVDCTLSTGLSVDVFSCSSVAMALSRIFIAALWSTLSDHAQRLQSKRARFRFPASTYPHLLHCWLVYDGSTMIMRIPFVAALYVVNSCN